MATKATTKKYFEAVGRRKTAIARVRLHLGAKKNSFTINDRAMESYFPTNELSETVRDAMATSGVKESFEVTAKIQGGGPHAQAEAMRHGISRALSLFNPEFRSPLKKAGFIKRDPRSVERKKPGLKKARKSPQWSKR